MLVCPLRTFRILRRLKIVKFLQRMQDGARQVHKWTHKEKVSGLFVFFKCGREPFVAFVCILGDQSVTRTATFMNLACAPPFSCVLFLWLSEQI